MTTKAELAKARDLAVNCVQSLCAAKLNLVGLWWSGGRRPDRTANTREIGCRVAETFKILGQLRKETLDALTPEVLEVLTATNPRPAAIQGIGGHYATWHEVAAGALGCFLCIPIIIDGNRVATEWEYLDALFEEVRAFRGFDADRTEAEIRIEWSNAALMAEVDRPPRPARLEVTEDPPQAILDGTAFAVKRSAVPFLAALATAPEREWVSGSDHVDQPSRAVACLPEALRSWIESCPGKGFRLRPRE